VAVKNKDRSLFGGGGREGEESADIIRARRDKELVDQVAVLEKELDELRATYELFFMGIEKIEPQPHRDLVKAKLRRLQESQPRNTALKFRIQQLKARLVSLENYWQRTLRQREAGTYRRDLARLERRNAERIREEARAERLREEARAERLREEAGAGDAPASGPGRSGASIDSGVLAGGASASSSGAASRGGGGAPAYRPRARSAEDLTEPTLRKLYDTYLGARRRCGESTNLRYEDMASALRKQVPKLLDKTGARSVEFKVVIRGGKAILKALPRSDRG
jgi:hypothetical protein